MVPTARIQSITVHFTGYSSTLGLILKAEEHGASKYPNELRYGGTPKDFSAEALAKGAVALGAWIEEHWNEVRKP